MLKDKFYLDQTFFNVANTHKYAKNVIKLYNEVKLHLSLNFKIFKNVYKRTD